MSIRTAVALALGCCVLGGCQSASIRSLQDDAEGISYYLPQRLLKITYTRALPETEATKVFVKAKYAAEAAAAAAKESKAAFEAAEELRKAADPASPAYPQLEKEAAYLAVLMDVAAKTNVDAQATLAKAIKALVAEQTAAGNGGPCPMVERLAVAPTALLPDPNKRFVASIEHRMWRRDDVKLNTTKEGLLTSSTATLTDQTNDILVALFSSISSVRSGTGNGVERTMGAAVPSDCVANALEMTVDPSDLSEVNTALRSVDAELQLRWAAPRGYDARTAGAFAPPRVPAGPASPVSCNTRQGKKVDCGLLYRRELTHLLRIENLSNEIITTVPVALPNFSRVERVNFNSTSFATNVHSLTFDNGMLTEAKTDQPSELLAIVKVPTNIISGVLQSIATIVQLRVNVGTQSSALAQQELALACAMDRLESTQTGSDLVLPESLCP